MEQVNGGEKYEQDMLNVVVIESKICFGCRV